MKTCTRWNRLFFSGEKKQNFHNKKTTTYKRTRNTANFHLRKVFTIDHKKKAKRKFSIFPSFLSLPLQHVWTNVNMLRLVHTLMLNWWPSTRHSEYSTCYSSFAVAFPLGRPFSTWQRDRDPEYPTILSITNESWSPTEDANREAGAEGIESLVYIFWHSQNHVPTLPYQKRSHIHLQFEYRFDSGSDISVFKLK